MTLRHLSIFLEVCHTMNMSAAAKNLYMTQPSVSQAIKELETFYGSLLFERLSQRLYLTPAGSTLYQYANEILSLQKESIERISTNKFTETIRIGGNYTAGLHMISDITSSFQSKNPDTEFQVIINKAPHLKQLLHENQIDLALMEESKAKEDRDFIQKPFFKDKIVLVIPPSHPFSKKSTLSINDISAEKFLTREKGVGARELFEGIMNAHGYPFTPAWESISATILITEK